MKHIVLALTIFLLSSNSYCQNSIRIPTIEIDIGINHLLGNNEIEPKLGFGMSIKRIWFSDNKINLVSGLLFEKTKYFDDYVQCGHFCHYENIKYNIYSFLIPFMLRANAGKKYRLFIESGPTFEVIPFKWGKGTEISYSPLSNTSETEISGYFEHDLTDFGVNIGIGIIFPINNYNFIFISTYHNSFKSIFDKQQNELTEYFIVKIGILIN